MRLIVIISGGVIDRTAIFVDAGWLLAAAAIDLLGTPRRDDLEVDYKRLVAQIEAQVDAHSDGAPRLRTYWYDGAAGGAPSPEHDRIGGLPYVKVRLGRLNRARQQKGVDVLLYHDLLTLARERAITRAYLIAGDEDLREGVAEAQKIGVQVVLLGMPIEKGHNQSARLVRECDEHLVLPRAAWRPCCRRRSADDAAPAHEDVVAARRAGGEFAREWAGRADDAELADLLARFPTLPGDMDVALLSRAEETLGSLRGRPDVKTELRGTFWFALKEVSRARRGEEASVDGR